MYEKSLEVLLHVAVEPWRRHLCMSPRAADTGLKDKGSGIECPGGRYLLLTAVDQAKKQRASEAEEREVLFTCRRVKSWETIQYFRIELRKRTKRL